MNTPPKMERAGNVKIITFMGSRIGDDIGTALANELDAQPGGHLLLDFTHVESIGSEELGTLVAVHKRMSAAGGRLTLFHLTAQVFEVFTVTRLQTILEICRESTS